MENQIRNRLLAMVDPSYQRFNQSLLPGISNIIGVRLPQLRVLAKEILQGDWRAFLQQTDKTYRESPKDVLFEETMLQGIVIGMACCKKSCVLPLEDSLALIAAFVPKINNWAVCDCFCGGLKFVRSHTEPVWQFLQPYLNSEKEYKIRFGVVSLLNFYLDTNWLADVLEALDHIHHEGYYAKMAVAWTLSMAYIKFPETLSAYFDRCSLDDWTYRKTLQKILESRKLPPEQKEQIQRRRKNL